jgi:hypothetical protein
MENDILGDSSCFLFVMICCQFYARNDITKTMPTISHERTDEGKMEGAMREL